MKKIALFLAFSIYSIFVNGQKRDTIYFQHDTVVLKRDTALRNKLLTVSLKKFFGKKVSDLLNDNTIKLYKSYYWVDEPPGVLSALRLSYARGLDLEIVAYPLKYTSRFSKAREFDINLFKKEKISSVSLDRDFFEENVVKKYAQ